jgi:hypothetical protein
MSRNRRLWVGFVAKYGSTLTTVGDYYALKKGEFSMIDVSSFVPGLVRRDSDDVPDSELDGS